ncbi:MAG: helix-turn-helix domain-containing protein [Pseudobdellovibrionaceae bacterium]
MGKNLTKNSDTITPYGHLATLKLLQIAAYDKDINNAARRIFMIIAGHADIDGRCWPSINKIACSLGIKRSAVNKQTKILKTRGYLEIQPRHDEWTGAQKSNEYILNLSYAAKNYEHPDLLSEYPRTPKRKLSLPPN